MNDAGIRRKHWVSHIARHAHAKPGATCAWPLFHIASIGAIAPMALIGTTVLLPSGGFVPFEKGS